MVHRLPDSSPTEDTKQTFAEPGAPVKSNEGKEKPLNWKELNWKHLRVIEWSKNKLNKVLGKYERDLSMAPAKIPLNDIHTNTEQFQIRKTPYSEDSVCKIITSIKKWDFVVELFNPAVLWFNNEDEKLYILAGHSRYEAYRRLSDPSFIDPETQEPLCNHPKVVKFKKQRDIDFTSIWAHVVENKTLSDAKRISAISNTLWTPESLIDRATYYQVERTYKNLSDDQLKQEYKTFESKNRDTVLALSYLNSNGKTMHALESFSKNDDIHKDILKISKRIGEARRKHSRLSDLHEDELYEWLIEHKWYGFTATQVSTQHSFLKNVSDRIAKLQEKKAFRADRKLNMLNRKKYSYALQQYDNLLAWYRRQIASQEKQRKMIEKQIVALNVAHNKEAIDDIVQLSSKMEQQKDNIATITASILQMELNFKLAESLRFEFKGNDKQRLKNAQEILSNINYTKEKFKDTRNQFIEAQKAQWDLFFMLEGGQEECHEEVEGEAVQIH